jgi:TPP-dependent pyruvate/acetoin dehydrogenase alpha subunit
MEPDLWNLYRLMLYSRLFEEVVKAYWEKGLISGEMHMSAGEEGVIAGVVSHLQEGDALALDHRGTAPLLMRGVDPVLLLKEFMGRTDGLCRGQGGHMSLFSPQHLAAASSIVGASGPKAAGFALAAQHLRPGTLAVAFFGEGAANQGMLLESLNLAMVWHLPMLFVCKDNQWAITTPSREVSSGALVERARGFGMPAEAVDGRDVEAVWWAAQRAIRCARQGEGPTFLQARCIHCEGHFLGDPLLRVAQNPLREMAPIIGPLLRSMLSLGGAPIRERIKSLSTVSMRSFQANQGQKQAANDPLRVARQKLVGSAERLRELEEDVRAAILGVIKATTGEGLSGGAR